MTALSSLREFGGKQGQPVVDVPSMRLTPVQREWYLTLEKTQMAVHPVIRPSFFQTEHFDVLTCLWQGSACCDKGFWGIGTLLVQMSDTALP